MELYDQFPYEDTFEAHVVSCKTCKQGYDVVLNQTLFFPEEGGQNCDKGTIQEIDVFHVEIIQGVVHHYLAQPIQGKVKGKIDFVYRYSQMQNHSGEHILSGLIKKEYGFSNVGFHLGDNEITTDYDGMLSQTQLDDIEKKVNQVISANLPIRCYYPENLDTLEYRSKKEIAGDIRIVEIPGVDRCACCAPHVRFTGEIGVFKILKVIKHKQGMRVYFLCGKRAIEDYQHKHEEAILISNMLSSPVEKISEHVKRILDENNELKQKLSSLKREQINRQCQNLIKKDQHLIFIDEIDRSLQQYYVNQLLKKSQKMAAVFVGKEKQFRFMIASLNDARIYLDILKKHYPTKGGGKKDMVQGTVEATQEEITLLFSNN